MAFFCGHVPNCIAEVPITWKLGATDVITVDAGSIDHTGSQVMGWNVDVNSASIDVCDMDIDITTALTAGELVRGMVINITGLDGDAATSGYHGLSIAVNCVAQTVNVDQNVRGVSISVALPNQTPTGEAFGGKFTLDRGLMMEGSAYGLAIEVEGVDVGGSCIGIGLTGNWEIGIQGASTFTDFIYTTSVFIASSFVHIDSASTITLGINFDAADMTTGMTATGSYSDFILIVPGIGKTVVDAIEIGGGEGAVSTGINILQTCTANAIYMSGNNNITVDNGNLTIQTTTVGDMFLTSISLMDINAGANLDIDVTGNYTMDATGTFSIDGVGASNVTATHGALTVSTLRTAEGAGDGITVDVADAVATEDPSAFAGGDFSLTAGNAAAVGSAIPSAASGGSVAIVAGNAAQGVAGGNADGGNISITCGNGVGMGIRGAVLFTTDNEWDIGAVETDRARTLYLGTSLVVPTITVETIDFTPASNVDAIDIIGTNMTTASAIDIDLSAHVSGQVIDIAIDTTTIQVDADIIRITDSRNHDNLAADAYRGVTMEMSGDFPGSFASTTYLVNAEYSGTLGATGGDAIVYAIRGDLSGATLTAGTYAAGYFAEGTNTAILCDGTYAGNFTGVVLVTGKLTVTGAIDPTNIIVTTPDGGNIETIAITQNDITNNPAAVTITNAGTGDDITGSAFSFTNAGALTCVGITNSAHVTFSDSSGVTTINTGDVAGVSRAFHWDIPIIAGGAAAAALGYQFLIDGTLEAGLLAETNGVGGARDAVWKVPYYSADYGDPWAFTPPSPEGLVNGSMIVVNNTNATVLVTDRLYIYTGSTWTFIDL